MCVMYMIRNEAGLYWSINRESFRESAYATCFDSKLYAYSYVNRVKDNDVFGTDHLIVEEVICL